MNFFDKLLKRNKYNDNSQVPEDASPLRYDPIEDDPKFKDILEVVEAEVEMEIGIQKYRGYCHIFWKIKKRILKEDYGINWKSPAELNPNVLFD